jgi:hypothetical protein
MLKSFSKVSLLLLISFLLQLSACQEEPPLILTSSQRDQLDTLYTLEVTKLAGELDSICDQILATEMDATVDSLLALRKKQERDLRQKYQKK